MVKKWGRMLLVCVALAGCGGLPPGPDPGVDMGPTSGDGGLLAFGVECTANEQCESNLCTKAPYDRKPNPVCTYMCDPTNPNPKCPYGCNMKQFCKIP